MSHPEDEQRTPQPDERKPSDEPSPDEQPHDYPDPVDESSDDSFPASDPPSFTESTATLDAAAS